MILTQEEAVTMAKRVGGMGTYVCSHCGGYHMATGSGIQYTHRRRKKAKGRTKSFSADADIFEVKTKDYDPNAMVPAIPPSDFTGKRQDWMDYLHRVLGIGNVHGIPLIRHADYCRLVEATEP